MTVLTGVVVATVVTGGAATAVTAPALAGIAPGAALGSAAITGATTTATAGVGSAGLGASAGAIAGATVGGTGAAAATGAAIGSASAAAVSSTGAGTAALVAGGPVGWLLLGGEEDASSLNATFDCWKPVLRDKSTELSRGKLLEEIFEDQRIKQVIVQGSKNNFNLPELSLINIWDEQFDLNYFVLPSSNQLVAHAVRVA
ncbi:hypothetical protein GHT06_011356 [Daphnia sinensis]|uniref:Uncharacterized protein n=1 Tax=Daphnia sinensis TaxID=1820382 RepID=A0AAD5LKA8_9CRUS|nr:hypothetical protein GHT06_011356 [Daphnia sinensis]